MSDNYRYYVNIQRATELQRDLIGRLTGVVVYATKEGGCTAMSKTKELIEAAIVGTERAELCRGSIVLIDLKTGIAYTTSPFGYGA